MTSCGSSGSTTKTVDNSRSKSCDTVCTNSSCFFKRRKPIVPYTIRPSGPKSTSNIVRQRVLSAKLQRVRSLQSQLNDANFHLAELIRENQALKTLQKRQDKALSKYENSNADLPRLLHQHEEEIRTLTEKNKNLRKNLKETTTTLKIKEDELSKAREQLQHLESLNKDKRLVEREKLLEKVEDLQFRLKKSDEQIAQLNKKLMLESKNQKHRLNAEIVKNKHSQREIIQAMAEIDKLTRLVETRDLSPSKRSKPMKALQRQSISLVNLDHNSNLEKLSNMRAPVSEVRLEPIINKNKEENEKPSLISQLPSDNIKSRLSSGSGKSIGKKQSREDLSNGELNASNNKATNFLDLSKSIDNIKKINKQSYRKLSNDLKDLENNVELDISQVQISAENSNPITQQEQEENDTDNLLLQNRSNNAFNAEDILNKLDSSEDKEEKYNSDDDVASNDSFEATNLRLNRMTQKINSAIQVVEETGGSEFDKKLGSYCSSVLTNVKKCSRKIKTHKQSIKMYEEDTDKILDSFNETKSLEDKLKKSFLTSDKGDFDFLNDIFKDHSKTKGNKINNKNSNNNSVSQKQAKVTIQDKDKLLATLRAIDNGDNDYEVKQENLQKSSQILNELFADVSDI